MVKLLVLALALQANAAFKSAPTVRVTPKAGATIPALNVTPGLTPTGTVPTLNIGTPVLTPALTPIVNPAVNPAITPNVLPALEQAMAPEAGKVEVPGGQEQAAKLGWLFDRGGKNKGQSGGESDGSSISVQPTNEEIQEAYKLEMPKSNAGKSAGAQFAESAAHLITKHTFDPSLKENIDTRHPRGKEALEVVEAHDKPARKFLELLGAWMAFHDLPQRSVRIAAGREPHMPPAPIPGEYWDMAAGINSGSYIHTDLKPENHYSFFDLSPFVVSYIKTNAALAKAANVSAVEADILKLQKPEKPLAVLRTKNAIAYVPGFAKRLEEMTDWIAPGGQLVIQTDPHPGQRMGMVREHGPLIQRLMSQGWTIDYGFVGDRSKWGHYGYDTLTLTRPRQEKPVPQPAVQALWVAYQKAMAESNANFNPFFMFFR